MNTYINNYNQTTNAGRINNIRRGMVILMDLPRTEYNPHQHSGLHYYVIVANDKACKHSPVIQAIPFSSQVEKRRLPCHAEMTTRCLPKTSCLLGEQLTLIPKRLLEMGEYCGMLEKQHMQKVDQVMRTELAIA